MVSACFRTLVAVLLASSLILQPVAAFADDDAAVGGVDVSQEQGAGEAEGSPASAETASVEEVSVEESIESSSESKVDESSDGEVFPGATANEAAPGDVRDKADYYVEAPAAAGARAAFGPMSLSEEMKYFAKYESSCNYDQGFSYGDGYHALGYYQFDHRYGLRSFLTACYNYNSSRYSMFKQFVNMASSTFKAEGFVGSWSGGTFTFSANGKALNAAWHSAYAANPSEFSALQDAWAYNQYYLPAENYLASRGVDISGRADCVKGLCWGMSNLFGTGGWRKFVGGYTSGYHWDGTWRNGYDWPGCGLSDSMTDIEFVTKLCNYVVDNVAVFYKAQPQYHEGWQNRYRSELADCLSYLDGLVAVGGGYKYRLADGSYLTDSWKTVSGKTYYFGSDGFAARWETEIDGDWYYFDSGCAMWTGWLTWKADGRRSYYGPDGVRASGWKTISGKRYYLDPSEPRNAAARYAKEIGGKSYYFYGSGAMHTGLLTWNADGRKSYYGSDGVLQSGWMALSGEEYYFDPADSLCRAARWETEIDGDWYYFDSGCAMWTGWLTWKADGRRSYYGPDGVRASGWKTISGKRYYLDPSEPRNAAARYAKEIGGKSYYFYGSGAMHTGWLKWKADGKWSYYGSDGAMYTGKRAVNGVSYDFGTSGKIPNAVYSADKVLGVPRNTLITWLESKENTSYYLGTKYSAGLSPSTCMYPKGSPRSDGFTGMNCTGLVAHAYRAAGGNLTPISKTNSHSPWSGGPGRGSYVNAWRWYGYAVDSGAEMYTFNSVSAMLASGKARKGDIIFFKTNGIVDCHIGFFWGDTSNENKMWHQILGGCQISTCFNNANRSGHNQKVVLIKGM